MIVGPEGVPFFFHESLLCERSPWFRAQLHLQMFEGCDSGIESPHIESSFCDFKQSQRKVIYRYEDDIHTFNQFFSWIYGCVYAMPRCDPENYSPATHISEWVRLHALAVEMGVSDLAEKALWEYINCRDILRTGYWLPLQSEIQFIYTYRTTTSDLRKLIVQKVRGLLFSMRFDGLDRRISTLCLSHPDFHAEVLQEIQMHVGQGDHYHYGDCSMHISCDTSTYSDASPSPYFEVETPPRESEYLDNISDLELDGVPSSLVSDCSTISIEEEDVYSEQGRNEAMAEYYAGRDMAISFDPGNQSSILD